MDDAMKRRDTACAVCGPIGTGASAFEKGGWPEQTVLLPAAVGALETICGWESGGRGEKLLRCAACGDHFQWTLSYEYLVGGTEDETTLARLSELEADRLRVRLGG